MFDPLSTTLFLTTCAALALGHLLARRPHRPRSDADEVALLYRQHRLGMLREAGADDGELRAFASAPAAAPMTAEGRLQLVRELRAAGVESPALDRFESDTRRATMRA
jgi:hypothetical protein